MCIVRVVCLSVAVTSFLFTPAANAEPPERVIKRALSTCLIETSSPRPNETGSVDLSMPRQDLQLARALEQFRADRDAALAADPGLKGRSLEVDARPTGGVRTVPVGETLVFCDTELQARIDIWKRRMAAATAGTAQIEDRKATLLADALKRATGDRQALLKQRGLPTYWDGKDPLGSPYWTFGRKEEPQVECRYTYYFKADTITRTEVAPPRCDQK
ncbi:MAG TPA: hypothetical protein VH877_24145 [Polyangia bacterium]|nr:hypothetical protein [Polyangia bacterium]